jgi:hypothetical protein
MIKLLLLSLLAIANCQNVIEIGSSPQKTGIQFQSGNGIRSFSGLTGLSGLGSIGGSRSYQIAGYSPSTYGYNLNAARPVAFSLGNYGLGNYGLGSYGLGNYGLGNYGLGSYGISNLGTYGLGSLGNIGVSQIAVRPQAVTLVAAQPAAAVAAQPVSVVAAQPASVNFVSGGVQQVGLSYGQQSQQVVPVSAAIHSTRTVEYKAVPYNDEPLVPQVVEVEPSEIPLNIHFKSRSSTIKVSQSHEAGEPGTVEQTQSQDEPSRVIHEVHKPVIQEVREVITPYRQVTQEVQPVVEQVHTVVARGEGVRQQYIAQQPIVQQQVRQVQAIAQPVASFQAVQQPAVSSFAIQQPVSAIQAVARPAVFGQAVRSYAAQPVSSSFSIGAAQPVQSYSIGVAQPVQSYSIGVAQPVQSYSIGVAQPVSDFVQSVRSVQQPASVVSYSSQPVLSGVAVEAQPAISFRSGSALNSLVGSRSVGGSSVVVGRSASLPAVGSATFSRTFAENAASDDDESK